MLGAPGKQLMTRGSSEAERWKEEGMGFVPVLGAAGKQPKTGSAQGQREDGRKATNNRICSKAEGRKKGVEAPCNRRSIVIFPRTYLFLSRNHRL
jgi:hypothetical protein